MVKKDFGFIAEQDFVPTDEFVVILDDLNSREEPKRKSCVFSFLKLLSKEKGE